MKSQLQHTSSFDAGEFLYEIEHDNGQIIWIFRVEKETDTPTQIHFDELPMWVKDAWLHENQNP